MNKLFDDKRPIEAIWPGPDALVVGKDGVEKIEVYQENGQLAPVAWFAVYKKGVVSHRVNAAHVETVLYVEEDE